MNDDLIKKAADEYAMDTNAKRLETYPEAMRPSLFPGYDTDDLADAFEAGAKFALAKQNNDAEGNDTLTCGKGWAVKLYKIAYSAYAVGGNKWYQGYMKAMRDLFGTMWLDYADSSNVEILEKSDGQNRLHIAAMIEPALITNPDLWKRCGNYYAGPGRDTAHSFAELALEYADALIAVEKKKEAGR